MAIPFTQYLRPDGRTRPITIELAEDVETRAHWLIENGCCFEAEVLTTGTISLTCEKDGELVSIQLSENGPVIPEAVVSLIDTACTVLGNDLVNLVEQEAA